MQEINNLDANDVCTGKKSSRQKFILAMSDHVLWLSKKWHNNVTQFEDSYKMTTQSGKEINISDDISDTWVWLLKKIVLATCKFKNIKDAKLSTYIFKVLNSSFTFNDWLKNKYGDTAYVPNIIRKLPEDHQRIYTLLKRKTNINKICNTLNLEKDEAEYIIHEIKAVLFEKGKGGMLSEKWIKIDNHISTMDGESIDYINNLEDLNNINLESNPDLNEIYHYLEEAFLILPKIDQRLLKLYWAGNLNVNQILLYIKEESNLDDFKNMVFNTDRDFYVYIEKLILKCDKYLKDKHIDFYNKFELNNRKIKNSLKVMIGNFDI